MHVYVMYVCVCACLSVSVCACLSVSVCACSIYTVQWTTEWNAFLLTKKKILHIRSSVM